MERHRFDPLSAGFGLVFILLAVPTLVADLAVPWRVVWPVGVVIIGVFMLVGVLRGDDRI